MEPVLAYWDTRALCQPIRLLLEYAGVKYVDKRYVVGPGPSYDKSEWLADKNSMGFDFPNLPYYIDGDVKLTETTAIIRYLARKYHLCGKTQEQQFRADMFDSVLHTFKWKFLDLIYGDGTPSYNFEEEKRIYLNKLPAQLQQFENFIGDRPWFSGDEITYVDFVAFETLDTLLMLEPTSLDHFEKLRSFHQRFAGLERIKSYLNSSNCIKSRISNKYAAFGHGQ